jgi:hypothetical protein
MNAFINEKPDSANLEPDLLLDWRVDIDRISRRAREAFWTETPDPWTRIEAECVIQLIDAELIAMANQQSRRKPMEATIRHLKALRMETVLAIKTLDAVERHSTQTDGDAAAAPLADNAAGANSELFSLPPDPAATPFLNMENA